PLEGDAPRSRFPWRATLRGAASWEAARGGICTMEVLVMTTDAEVRFYDAAEMEHCAGMALEPVPVKKLGVVFDRAVPSDLDEVSVFAGSVLQLPDGRYRMYYSCRRRREGPLAAIMRLALAESDDALHWTRPMLGQIPWKRQDTNHFHILGLPPDANVTQPSVVRLPDDTWRMYFWLHAQEEGMIRYLVADSPEGLCWTLLDLDEPALFHPADLEVGQAGWTAGLTGADPGAKFHDRRTWPFAEAKRSRSNDATYVYFDEETGGFEMFSVWLLPNRPESGRQTPHDNAPGVLRVIHRRFSRDGIHFGDPELVLLPDAADPITQQFYYLAQHREPGWRIGFLGNYPCWEQTMDIEMCFSRDGRRWLRPLRGGFVPRDPVPEPGCMSAYATNSLLPVKRNRWLLLYRAGNTLHNHRLGPGVTGDPWSGVMAATWPRGRFAGLRTAPHTVGRILLQPRIQIGEAISLNADIRGWARAELRDPLGGRLPGFELHASRPLQGNDAHLVLRWGDQGYDSSRFRYDAVQLYLQVADGIVYGVHL
ncbi:MAG: hypothetical protein JXR77_11995, partial [Lentisphaeria bacterium]|nr:hypothetical protein [Lentisphaeria bacterium]